MEVGSAAKWLIGRRGAPTSSIVNVPGVPLAEVNGIHQADLDEPWVFLGSPTQDVEDRKAAVRRRSSSAGTARPPTLPRAPRTS